MTNFKINSLSVHSIDGTALYLARDAFMFSSPNPWFFLSAFDVRGKCARQFACRLRCAVCDAAEERFVFAQDRDTDFLIAIGRSFTGFDCIIKAVSEDDADVYRINCKPFGDLYFCSYINAFAFGNSDFGMQNCVKRGIPGFRDLSFGAKRSVQTADIFARASNVIAIYVRLQADCIIVEVVLKFFDLFLRNKYLV